MRQYEVQRAIKICKAHKVRHKHIKQIEEYLNLQYVIEEQLFYYNKEIRKVRQARDLLDQGTFSSFFVELYEERMSTLIKIEAHCLMKVRKLEEKKQLVKMQSLIYYIEIATFGERQAD